MSRNNALGFITDRRYRGRIASFGIVLIGWGILEVMLHSGSLSSLFTSLLVPVCCYIVAAIGLNLNVGISGELNLGQACFMSVGAFTAVCVSGSLAQTVPSPSIRLIISINAGALLAALVAVLIGIPLLKL